MTTARRYDACAPRQYETSGGEKKTHFWNVGTAFPLKERDGLSVKLWTRLLPTDELVLFLHEARDGESSAESRDDRAQHANQGKRYDICAPRPYKTGRGEDRTHFWNVGTAFPLKERDGYSLKLWTRLLPTDELVLFVHEPRGSATSPTEAAPDDDIPF